MTSTPGSSLRTVSGQTLILGRALESGGQGTAYLARCATTAKALVLKTFSARYCNDATRRRIDALVRRNLSAGCPVLFAPFDKVDAGGILGHVACFAAGGSLETYLEAPSGSYVDHLAAALALARGVAVTEGAGFGHGDLQGKNVKIEATPGLLKLRLIDFDNFIA